MIQQTGTLIPPSGFLTGQLVAPKGTRIPFNMSAPPLGWTTDASSTYTDCYSTVRSGSGGSSGGSTNWSGWSFGGNATCNTFFISIANMPTHNHATNDPGHTHIASSGLNFLNAAGTGAGTDGALSPTYATNGSNTNGSGAGMSITANGGGAGVTPILPRPQVKYTDLIIGVKS